MTTGFIANAPDGEKLASLAQIKWPLQSTPLMSETVISEGNPFKLKFPLSMACLMVPDGANTLLQASADQIFMTQNQNKNICVLNSHTFSQQDFDAVGEVLLCPRQLGLLELPKPWVNTIRSAFQQNDSPLLDAPSRVTMQQLADKSLVIHNYNQEPTEIQIQIAPTAKYTDAFTGKPINSNEQDHKLTMEPRSRVWIKEQKNK